MDDQVYYMVAGAARLQYKGVDFYPCPDVITTSKAYLDKASNQPLMATLVKGIHEPGSFDLIFKTDCFEHLG